MIIAHISDIHLCSNYKRRNVTKTKKIIKHALEQGAEHFVITGDISDNANEKDYLILRKILQTYNLLRADKTSIVIGNHDIYGGVQTAADILSFPAKCVNTNYKQKVESFYKNFQELFENSIFASDENLFPYAKILGNTALVGINSIDEYSKIKNPFASNGLVNKTQRNLLKKLLLRNELNDKLKIAMIHHHFYKNNITSTSSQNNLWNKIESFTMKLRKKKKLIKIFLENSIKLVLHGHSHEIADYYRKGIRFLNAGGSVDNETENDASLFLIDTSSSEIKVSLTHLKSESNPVKTKIDTQDLVFSAA